MAKKRVQRLLNGTCDGKDIVFRCVECDGTDVFALFHQDLNSGAVMNGGPDDWKDGFTYCCDCGDYTRVQGREREVDKRVQAAEAQEDFFVIFD